MTTPKRSLRRAFVACLVLCVAACGSDTAVEGQAFNIITGLFKKGEPAKVSHTQIVAALQANSSPLALFEFESREGTQGLLSQIEVNGAYHTFGNQARNVIVLRDGMITATRGIGGDLMSVEEDALLRLVKSRSLGTATYVQRFLQPSATTITISYRCAAHPEGQKQVALGLVNELTTRVRVDCYGDDPETGKQLEFTNTYEVSASGMVLSGRQWLGDYIGFINSQYLRY